MPFKFSIKKIALSLTILLFTVYGQTDYHVTGVSSPPTTYAGIQEAIDSIPADLSGLGVQSVTIDSGFYNENLLIDGFSNNSATDYILLRASPGHNHQGDTATGVKVSGTGNPMVTINESYTQIQDIVIIQEGTGTSSVIQTVTSGTNNVLLDRLVTVRNGNGFIITTGSNTEMTIRSIIAISNYASTGTFSCVRIGGNSVAENVTIWSDGDQNGGTGCSASIELDDNAYAKNVVAFGKTPTNGHFKDDGGSAETDYNFSTDGSAPGDSSLINQASADLQFVDTANWDLHIGDSSLSVISEAGIKLASRYTIDIDSTCFNTIWSMGAHDLNTSTNCPLTSIVVSRPFLGETKQRDSQDSCRNYIISGSHTGATDSLEYKLQDSWIPIDTTGGIFADTIKVDTGAWTLYVRHSTDTTIIDSTVTTGCGEVLGVFGESNSATRADSLFESNIQPGTGAYVAGCGITNYQWKAPWGGDDHKPGVVPPKGSWQAPLGDLLAAELKVPIAIISFADYDCSMVTNTGGSDADWFPTGRCFDTAMVIRDVCDIDTIGYPIFYGGEADANKGYTSDTISFSYKRNYTALSDSLNFTAPMTIHQIGAYHQILADALDSNGLDSIRSTGIDLAETDTNFYVGAPLYDINLANDAGDSIHMGASATKGYLEIDTLAARFYRMFMANYKGFVETNPPFINSGQYILDSVIEIGFNKGANKLKTIGEINAMAFEVYDSIGQIYPDSAVLQTDSTVYLYLPRDAEDDTLLVSFASKNYGVEVLLSDSSSLGDDYNLPPEPCLEYQILPGSKNETSCFEGSITAIDASLSRFFFFRRIYGR